MTHLQLQNRKIVFVGGKGGVGKTTTASALALQSSGRKIDTLLVSTDPAHSLGDLFDRSIGPEPRELAPHLWGLELDPDRQVEAYLAGVKGTMQEFVRPEMFAEVDRQIELARHAPGAVEAAMLERMARLMDDATESYDRIIFDTAPTGHTLRLLALPEIMTAWMDGLLRGRDRSEAFGKAVERLTQRKRAPDGPHTSDYEASSRSTEPPADELSWFQHADEAPESRQGRKIRELLLARRRSFARARRLLLDREATAFVMVLIPEKLPILETQKALQVLHSHKIPVAGLVVNRVLPEQALGDFLEHRREQENAYLAQIDRLFGDLNRVRVPLLQRDVDGLASLREVARHLPLS